MWSDKCGAYTVCGYNDKEQMIARVVADKIESIKRAVANMYFDVEVKSIGIQAYGDEPTKVKDYADLYEKMDELIENLKTTNKELSKICNAICMK